MAEQHIIPSFDLYKTLNNALGFELSNLEQSYNLYDASLPHRHNYYEILFFKQSGGTHEIDFNSYPIVADSLHFISPEQVHLLRRQKHVTGFVLSFTKEFLLEEKSGALFIDNIPFLNNPYATAVVKLNNEKEKKEITELLSKITEEFNSSDIDKAEMLLSYLSILLIIAKRIYNPGDVKAVSVRTELTHRFKKLIEKNFLKNNTVSDYAEMLSITAGHLNDTVQKENGKTASEMIHERIILEAKRLLYHSPKSVKEIAFELQYEDPSYFTKFFKNHTQQTPEQFRKQIREKYH